MRLFIIIPAHNEEDRIAATLKAYVAFFSGYAKQTPTFSYELLVVINNTQDRTEHIVKELAAIHPEIKSINFLRGGKGFAIKEGFSDVLKRSNDEDLIGFVDADLATSPEAYADLLIPFAQSSVDGVIGSRWTKHSSTQRNFGKVVRSKLFNFLVRSLFLLRYRDTQCGAKIFRKHVIKSILQDIDQSKWSFDVNLLYACYQKHFRIVERPTIWKDQEGSKISWKVPLQMASGVIRLRLQYSPFRDLIRLYDRLPEHLKFHH